MREIEGSTGTAPAGIAAGAARPLSERQAQVLRAAVTAYVGEAAPVGSATLSAVLPTKLSAASVRATLAELAELGLLQQPHTSAGRVPTERGLRVFIDSLLTPAAVAEYDRRTIDWSVEEAPADALAHVASQLLSERTRLLGFVVAPRVDRLTLRHVSLVRLSSERLLAVLVGRTGSAHRRVVAFDGDLDQAALDRIAALLNERVAGRTLREVRDLLRQEARGLRRRADRLLQVALDLGSRVLSADEELERIDLVIATRLAMLDQPEFQDPRLLRDLFEALETKERLLEVLDQMIDREGVRVALGAELADPSLQHCALVATHYGDDGSPMGVLGVIGPSRMDYGRVIPLVDYLSRAVTDKLNA